MDKLQTLLAQLKAQDDKIDAILGADNATDEQLAEADRLTAERKKTAAAVKREQDRLAREEERVALQAEADEKAKKDEAAKKLAAEKAARTTPAESANGGRLTTVDAPGATAPVIVTTSDRIPAHVRRYTPRNFKGVVNGRDAQERSYRFGMWALSRVAADMPNRFRFKEATEFVSRQMVSQENDANGGNFLVPPEFGTDLIDLREIFGVSRRMFKMVPMISDTRTDPRRQSGLTAYFVAEGAAGTESTKVWNDVRLTAKDLMVLSRYTNQLNMDAVINIGDDLAGEIAYAFANKEDDCAFNGTGISTYGGIYGVRFKLNNCDLLGTQSAGLYLTSHATWATLTLVDLQNVVALLPQYADTPNAAWVCHRAFYYGVMQVLELAAGGVTALEVQQGDRRPRPLFLGYPVNFSQIWPSTTAAAACPVALGDFSLGASFGDRQQDQIAFSEHASIGGQNVFEQNQIAIRGTERFDVNVHDAGTSSAAGPIVGLWVHA